MEQKIIDLYDSYTHGGMSRRSFLDRLAMLAGGTAAATALLPMLREQLRPRRYGRRRAIRA